MMQRSKKDKLEPQKIELFDIFHDWQWEPLEDAWEHFFLELKNYHKVNGHKKVYRNYKTLPRNLIEHMY